MTKSRFKFNMEDSHTKPYEEVVNYFRTDENTGLDDAQVKSNQEKYGPNGEYNHSFHVIPSKSM